jgi:thioester reductase-like protein
MRSVFVTGGTGAIGNVLARYLLEESDTQLHLLLRAQSHGHVQERLEGLCRFWGVDARDEGLAHRVHGVAGDVTLPTLGMDPGVYRRLAAEVTHVIHSAGNVKLNRPLDEARRAALDSARHVISFVQACGNGSRFQKLEYVSTVGVAGKTAGTVLEQPISNAREFRNSYEAAKAEAEVTVLDAMERGLNGTIHRPSMVVGDSRDGKIIQFQVFYHLCELLSGARTGGVIPDPDDIQLDIIPVDYVARAIHVSSKTADASGRIFHLCAGPIEAPRVWALAQRVREVFAAHGRRVPRLRPVPPGVIRKFLPVATKLVSTKTARALRALPYFLAYLDPPQTFANVQTRGFFSTRGVDAPSVASYLDAVLSYYLRRTRDERMEDS